MLFGNKKVFSARANYSGLSDTFRMSSGSLFHWFDPDTVMIICAVILFVAENRHSMSRILQLCTREPSVCYWPVPCCLQR